MEIAIIFSARGFRLKVKKKIIWKTLEATPLIASFRHRCALPAFFLQKLGWQSIILQNGDQINKFNDIAVLIFVKTFSQQDLKLARKASLHNIPIIIDICDNIFIDNYPGTFAKYFDEIAKISDFIVTTGDELQNLVSQRNLKKEKILIIPDQAEDIDVLESMITYLEGLRSKKFELQSLGKFKREVNSIKGIIKKYIAHLRRLVKCNLANRAFYPPQFTQEEVVIYEVDPSHRPNEIIWFGNAGSKFSNFGMPSILEISDSLLSVHRKIPIKLVVVSNNYERYIELIKPLAIPTEYREWNMKQIFTDISKSDLCIVPNSKDDFSICKSPNRTLLALSLNVPVVATYIPSLEKFSDCIICDDWEHGIFTYLTDQTRKKTISLKQKAF